MTIDEALPAGGWTGRGGTPVAPGTGRLRPLGLREVTLHDGFWGRRQTVNGTATFAHLEHWLSRSGWLGNFDAAADGLLPGARRGREFADTEVYKLLEAMAWEYGRTRDSALDARYRALVSRVAAAQEPDGYLNTNFGRPGQAPRYSHMEWGHELYSFGHLIQAGVARARTTGDDQLVDVAIRAADHVCQVFGPDGRDAVCGHPEIEPALVELYRVTGARRYLDQAKLFIDRRGHHLLSDIEFGRSYFQDDLPVREATVLRGHAVRATYLAAGAVDVAVETGDKTLLDAVEGQWRATVARRTYITGGMGARHQDEAFGEDFFLPPDRAYSETCAAVGSVMLSWRLLLAQGDVRHADLIERTLFNVIATSPSDEGTAFFYANTLHQRSLGSTLPSDAAVTHAASTMRAPWFSVSCCPTNVARTFASLTGYLATVDDDGLQIHQYASSTLSVTLPDGRPVSLDVTTAYPLDGRVVIRVRQSPRTPWTLTLRIPAWATGATVTSAGDTIAASPGWSSLRRHFTAGDEIVLVLPVQPRLTFPDPRIDAVRDCAAIERGPEVLCAESPDLPTDVPLDALRLNPDTTLIDNEGTVTATLQVAPEPSASDWPYEPGPQTAPAGDHQRTIEVPLRPYHDWASRGPSTMRVWLPLA